MIPFSSLGLLHLPRPGVHSDMPTSEREGEGEGERVEREQRKGGRMKDMKEREGGRRKGGGARGRSEETVKVLFVIEEFFPQDIIRDL